MPFFAGPSTPEKELGGSSGGGDSEAAAGGGSARRRPHYPLVYISDVKGMPPATEALLLGSTIGTTTHTNARIYLYIHAVSVMQMKHAKVLPRQAWFGQSGTDGVDWLFEMDRRAHSGRTVEGNVTQHYHDTPL